MVYPRLVGYPRPLLSDNAWHVLQPMRWGIHMVALDAATLLSQNHLKLLSDLSEIPYSRVRNDSMRFSTFGELLALCHGKLDKHDEAIHSLKDAVQKDPAWLDDYERGMNIHSHTLDKTRLQLADTRLHFSKQHHNIVWEMRSDERPALQAKMPIG